MEAKAPLLQVRGAIVGVAYHSGPGGRDGHFSATVEVEPIGDKQYDPSPSEMEPTKIELRVTALEARDIAKSFYKNVMVTVEVLS
jgi:hypothetical protein